MFFAILDTVDCHKKLINLLNDQNIYTLTFLKNINKNIEIFNKFYKKIISKTNNGPHL